MATQAEKAAEKDAKAAQKAERPQPEGELPVVGNEGGIVKEGTGEFAPDAGDGAKAEAGDGEVVVETRDGDQVAVPVGVDGENPVSVENPPAKAVLGAEFGDRPHLGQATNPEATGRSEGAGGDRIDDDNK